MQTLMVPKKKGTSLRIPVQMTHLRTHMAGQSCKLALFAKPSQSLRRYQVRESSTSPLISDSCVDPPSVAQFSLSALKALHTAFGDDDQYYMYNAASEALTAAKRRGETRLLDFWSGRPVVSIELLQCVFVGNTRKASVDPTSRRPPPSRSLIENPISFLARRRSEDTGRLPQVAGPFLYNPRKPGATKVRWQRQLSIYLILISYLQGNTLVVTDELLEFVLT